MVKSIKNWKGYESWKQKMGEKVPCSNCGKQVRRSGMAKHQKSKKCVNHNDKTAGKCMPSSLLSSPVSSLSGLPAVKNKLIEINLKGEYDKMTETLNPKKKGNKEKKYQCGACGATFDNLNDGKCPDCGEQLQ